MKRIIGIGAVASIICLSCPSTIFCLTVKNLTAVHGIIQIGNSINGVVFGSQRQPVSNIDVELLDEFSRLISRTRTTAAGRYSFNGVRAGRYQVKVIPLSFNYEGQTQEYEIVNFVRQTATGTRTSGFENVQLDFYLKPRRVSNKEGNAVGIVFAQDVPSKAVKAYRKAVDAFENKDNEKAIANLNEALKIYPDYYLALERLGLQHLESKNYEESRNLLIRSVGVNPRAFNSWYGLAQTEYALKSFTAAIEAAQKAFDVNASSINALLLLSVSFKETGRYLDAEIQLKKADEIGKGKVAEVHWQLAKLYADKFKRFNAAADELEIYLKLDPLNPNAANITKLIAQFREKAKDSRD